MTIQPSGSAATRKRPKNAYEHLRADGWHEHEGAVRSCYWNNVRLYVTEAGDTLLDGLKSRGGRWVIEFAADVPLHVIVAAAEGAARRPTYAR